jgi:phage head maturation protease
MSQELEYRSAELAGVSYPDRTIELVVMPYEVEATVPYHGRLITEICSRGAWDGVESRVGRIRVNRDHQITRTCGRSVAFHPSRREGLVAELRISKTELGEETLALADDGVLDASAGFALMHDRQTGKVKPGAEVWETRSRRRLNHLYLDHIALTPDPAYETANVLAVRAQDPEATATVMPNRERLKIRELQELYASIDSRYISR